MDKTGEYIPAGQAVDQRSLYTNWIIVNRFGRDRSTNCSICLDYPDLRYNLSQKTLLETIYHPDPGQKQRELVKIMERPIIAIKQYNFFIGHLLRTILVSHKEPAFENILHYQSPNDY